MCATDVLRWMAGELVTVRIDAITCSVNYLCDLGFVSREIEPGGATRYAITDAGRNHLETTCKPSP